MRESLTGAVHCERLCRGCAAALMDWEFVLASAAVSGHGRDIAVTRRDVNEIQLAKGAIRAGIEIFAARSGIDG